MMEKEADMKLGAAAYCNGMEWAKNQRDEASYHSLQQKSETGMSKCITRRRWAASKRRD